MTCCCATRTRPRRPTSPGTWTDCDECAREHALALETLEAITPRALAVASPRLKERILAAIPAATLDAAPAIDTAGEPVRLADRWKHRVARDTTVLAIALAAAVLLAMILFPI